MQTRREFLLRAAALAGGALTGWAVPPEPDAMAAGRLAARFLAARQSPDGAWRSTHYGAFRDGDALTPLVLWALVNAASDEDAAITRGLRWLESLTAARSAVAEPWTDLRYPLFTAAYASEVWAKVGDPRRAGFWADLVERLRISPALGWSAENCACGAWSDAPAPPRLKSRTSAVPDMLAPNISATVLGLQALAATGRAARAATALPFLAQCQNFTPGSDDALDDGGFLFTPGDPIRNKAGVAGHDASGRKRYRSYGSATCDGLLALAACGVPIDDARTAAALAWLHRHAAGAEHGGRWPADRTDDRESLRYYHAQAFAAVLALAGESTAHRAWAFDQGRTLAADLCASQSPGGSWSSRSPHSFEDDPIVAIAFALRALSLARERRGST